MTDHDNFNTVAAGHLRAFVERIERLESEIKDLNSYKSEVYAEVKSHGFDAKVIKKIVADRRKDASERQEFETIESLYRSALGMDP